MNTLCAIVCLRFYIQSMNTIGTKRNLKSKLFCVLLFMSAFESWKWVMDGESYMWFVEQLLWSPRVSGFLRILLFSLRSFCDIHVQLVSHRYLLHIYKSPTIYFWLRELRIRFHNRITCICYSFCYYARTLTAYTSFSPVCMRKTVNMINAIDYLWFCCRLFVLGMFVVVCILWIITHTSFWVNDSLILLSRLHIRDSGSIGCNFVFKRSSRRGSVIFTDPWVTVGRGHKDRGSDG